MKVGRCSKLGACRLCIAEWREHWEKKGKSGESEGKRRRKSAGRVRDE